MLPTPPLAIVFVAGAALSLGASSVLVRTLERLAARARLSEALLGLIAALAANGPEITASVTAIVQGRQDIGIGVTLGSNVFNLASLLGLSAVLVGFIRLARSATLLVGLVAVWAALAAVVVVGGLGPAAGLVLVLAVLLPYTAVSVAPGLLSRVPLPASWAGAVRRSLHEEEVELAVAIHPRRGTAVDGLGAGFSLVIVVLASIVMERSGQAIGQALHLPQIVIGGVGLAAVTSLPNAVAAVYLARRGRAAAVLSEAMNSNTLNVAVGFLLPATIVGLPRPGDAEALVTAGVACGLTCCAVALAYGRRGLGRAGGGFLILAYLAYVAALLTLR